MTKKTIAVDVDDVLALHAESFIQFSNQRYGTRLTVEDYSDHWSNLWGEERDEIERRAAEFHVHENIIRFKRIQEADKAVQKLAQDYRLVIVTARRKGLIDVTHEWIDNHFPGVFDEFHFVPIWVPGNDVTKADICHQIDAEYLIDDLPRHCNLAAEAGITALLFGDYSWNRSEEVSEGVVRVSGWPEVLKYFYG